MTYAQRAVLVVEVMRALEQRGVERAGDEFKFQCFFPDRHEHGDLHWSASFNREKGVWCCRVCGARGGVLDLAKHLGVPWPPRKDEAAEAYRIPLRTLRRLTRTGRVPSYLLGRNRIIRPADLDRYLARCREQGVKVGTILDV
jgi:excisionase family DNA binding protein